MADQRWQRLQNLFHAASEMHGAQRQMLLDEECKDDHSLRHEIESMLAFESDSGRFIESTALEEAAKLMADAAGGSNRWNRPDSALVGEKVAHYQVLEKLGNGGMGVVYKAYDTKLDRLVALKFLLNAESNLLSASSWELSRIPTGLEAMERVQREARASSALDHPNICTVHEIGEYQGSPFIAMQFLAGRTLRHEIGGQPFPVSRLLDIGIQIADGLASAHAMGIVHRDIKPVNILVTPQRVVKILDFGLAKKTPNREVFAKTPSPTYSSDLSKRSEVADERAKTLAMGTIAYMSPEQVVGEELDGRSDIFSLGVTLFEMMTGEPPWQGNTPTEVFEKILHSSLPAVPKRDLSAELTAITTRATEKVREMRYQTVAQLRDDLASLKRQLGNGEAPTDTSLLQATAQLHSRRVWQISAVALLLATILTGVAFYYQSRRSRLTLKDTLVVADFTNTTGDSVFDESLKQALRSQLAQSPFLKLLPEAKEREQLRYMKRTGDTKIIGDVAREVCVRTGSKAMVAGLISSLGNHYVLALDVLNCQTGDSLATEQIETPNQKMVLKSLDDAANRLRIRLGESVSAFQKYDAPSENTTTGSLEALQSYGLGVKASLVNADEASIPYFERAIELDPRFPAAYVSLGNAYYNLNELAKASATITKAFSLREQTSDLEKMDIDLHYYVIVTGELEKAIEVCERWNRIYPRDVTPLTNMGFIYSSLGQHEKDLAEQNKALSVEPNDATTVLNLINAHVVLNQFEEAQKLISKPDFRKSGDDVLAVSYDLAFANGDSTQMQDQVKAAIGKPGYEDSLIARESNTRAYVGALADSQKLTQEAIRSARSAGQLETASGYRLTGALREADFGNLATARQEIIPAPNRSNSQALRVLGALAMARAGQSSRASEVADELDQQYPLDTLLHDYWLPTIRAAVAISRRDPSRAVQLLDAVRPYDLSIPQVPTTTANLYPVYLRGIALLELKEGELAAEQFQEILNHPGINGNYHLGALARLGLGRSYALQSGILVVGGAKRVSMSDPTSKDSITRAENSYEDFFQLWKHADADVPILHQARAEFKVLQNKGQH